MIQKCSCRVTSHAFNMLLTQHTGVVATCRFLCEPCQHPVGIDKPQACRLSSVLTNVWSCHVGGTSAVLTITPVLQHEGVRAAAVGLSNMLNSGGAVLSCSLHSPSQDSSPPGNGRSSLCQLDLVVKGHGTLLLYSNASPSSVQADSCNLPFQYDDERGRLMVSLSGERLQQHVVVAWR